MFMTILAYIVGWALIIGMIRALFFVIKFLYHYVIKGDVDVSANPFRWF